MKKITLLITCLALSSYIFPQQTISFESPEGFALGDLNAQGGWVVTGCGTGCFISNQVVTDEQATNGTQAMKIAPDAAFGSTFGLIFGGFYDLPAPVDYTTAVISYDIRITQQDANSSDFRFGVVGDDGMGGLFFTYVIDFNFEGNIRIPDATGTLINVGTWVVDTWYNVRAEVTGSNIVYFVDDVQVGTSVLLNDFDFISVRFVHDNFAGEGYLDNLRINDEDLSIDDALKNTFTHSYNKNLDILNLESSNIALTNVEIYSVLGQSVMSKPLSNTVESINVSSLNDGVYLAKVDIGGNTKTIKFIKN